jgi:hypothetical protein
MNNAPARWVVLPTPIDAYDSFGEAWCQELEVYHNPLADHPIDFELLPGATHWFEQDGEILCISIWGWSVMSSLTHLRMERAS